MVCNFGPYFMYGLCCLFTNCLICFDVCRKRPLVIGSVCVAITSISGSSIESIVTCEGDDVDLLDSDIYCYKYNLFRVKSGIGCGALLQSHLVPWTHTHKKPFTEDQGRLRPFRQQTPRARRSPIRGTNASNNTSPEPSPRYIQVGVGDILQLHECPRSFACTH